MKDVHISQRHAFAEGTYSNLQTQFRSYLMFCVYFRRNPFPADASTVCGYVQFLSRSMQPTSIHNYLSGVRTLHTLLGLDYAFSEDFHLQLVMRGISRIHPHVPRRATPITPDILVQFHKHMDHTDSLHLTVWACSLTLFFTLARMGSILPSSKKSRDFQGILTRQRIIGCHVAADQDHPVWHKEIAHTSFEVELHSVSSGCLHQLHRSFG